MRPNTVGPLRFALGLCLLMLLAISPALLILKDWNGNWGVVGALTVLGVIPALALIPFAFWGIYSERKRRRDQEFRER